MPMTVGLDWGASSHAVCALDESGTILVQFECSHTAAGLAELLRRLKQVAAPETMPVAIERPSGLVVETLAAAGHPVVPIHPNVVKACRPRYRAAGGKSDPGDAYMLADILRTDGHRFQPLTAVSGEIKALRALVRGRDDLVAQRVALTNQLRAVLDSFWPGVAAVFAALDSPIALAFIARYPTPESARWLGEKRMASFLRQQGYPGRRPQPSCWAGCARRLPARCRPLKPRQKAGSLARSSACWRHSTSRSARCPHASSRLWLSCRTDGSLCPFPEQAELTPLRCWPRSATSGDASRPSTNSRPRPGCHRSRTHLANAAVWCSALPVTTDYAPLSRALPTTPGMPVPGLRSTMPELGAGAALTLMPSACSREHGCVFSGAPGWTEGPTILSDTAQQSEWPPDQTGVDTGCLS